MKTEAIYGNLPAILGLVDISPKEMMYWQYCPIKLPGQLFETYPENLKQFEPLVDKISLDMHHDDWYKSYIYLTVKTMYCNKGCPNQRPGWHSDGYLTDDINYIWYDRNPTIFFHDGKKYSFSEHHELSLIEMYGVCQQRDESDYHTFPNKHLLKMDQTVLHRVNTDIAPGMRTFVKISVSKHKYALEGNSINHKLKYEWDYKPRKETRNCPVTD